MSIEILSWDSDFFKRKTGRIAVEDELKDIALLQTEECELVYVFSKCRQPVLENEGFKVLDTKVNYFKEADYFNRIDIPEIDVYQGALNDELIQLVLKCGWRSRFRMDEQLIGFYEELYCTWLRNSLIRSNNNEVFISVVDEKIAGFLSVVKSGTNGKMTLMAVDEEVRGKGIGNNFVRKADFWYHSHGLLTANVITQKENKGACSLFERNGYRIVDTEYIYHFYP